MKELPADAKPYKRTPSFTDLSVPQGLLKNHTTIEGAWAKIVVEKGKVTYVIEGDAPEEVILSPDRYGVVEPKVAHHVAPEPGSVFYVEFFRREGEF